MEAVLAAAVGYVIGALMKTTSTVRALVMTAIMWVVSLLVMAAAVNAAVQPAWVGFASLACAVAFFFGVRGK